MQTLTPPTTRITTRGRFAAVLCALALSACGGGGGGSNDDPLTLETPASAPDSLQTLPAKAVVIDDYRLQETQQIDDQTVEYTYRARLTNDNLARTTLTARITNLPAGVSVVDGDLAFADVTADGSVLSSDTFRLRRDLSAPFRVEDLAWELLPELSNDLSLSAQATAIRMTVGETRDIDYVLAVLNGGSGPLGIASEEIPPAAGLELLLRNDGSFDAAGGRQDFALTQRIHASAAGHYQLGLRVSLPGQGISRELTVAVTVVADDDGDGIENALDLCPASVGAAGVNGAGCAPQDAVDDTDFRIIEIGQIRLKARQSNVEDLFTGQLQSGLHVTGSLLLETPLGDMALLEADLIFEYGAGGPVSGIERLRGTAQVPFPAMGILEGAEIGTPVVADVGLDYGSNLATLQAPLQDDRQYLFFHFNAGFEASAGPIGFQAPGGQSVTFVLDPQDPFFFLTGSLPGLSEIAGVEDLGIGMSLQGFIPFAPQTTWGIDSEVGTFDAHLYLQGVIPFARLPLALDGVLAANLDPDKDGATIFNDPVPDTQYGGNGTLNVSVNFLRFFSFGFPLGDASVGLKVASGEQNAYLSGVLDPDTSFVPQELVPIRPATAVRMAGLISSDVATSYLRGEGQYRLNAASLGHLIGVDLNNLVASDATLDIDKSGFLLTGTTAASIHPAVKMGGNASLAAHFTGDPKDWYIDINGDMGIAGVGLQDVGLQVDIGGLRAGGDFVTPLSRIGLSGTIDRAGVNLRGGSRVTIPINGVEQVVEWVVDGAICGYEKVTDGVICGVDTVTNAAICGTKTITDGAICGYNVITDILKCGIDILGGAKTCKIAKSCSVANTCSVPKSCNIPRGCNKTTNITLPKGEFVGNVDLLLGSSGLGGNVAGDYCYNGNCQTLAGGRVKVTGNALEACITIPGGIGEVCAPF